MDRQPEIYTKSISPAANPSGGVTVGLQSVSAEASAVPTALGEKISPFLTGVTGAIGVSISLWLVIGAMIWVASSVMR